MGFSFVHCGEEFNTASFIRGSFLRGSTDHECYSLNPFLN